MLGSAQPHQAVRLVLRDGTTGARKAVFTGVADEWGGYEGSFQNAAGDQVPVAVGDRVVGLSLASDLHWRVLNVAATADVAANTVSGTCGNHLGPDVDIYRRGKEVGHSMFPNVDDQGNFVVDFNGPPDMGFDPANIKHGDRVVVACPVSTGDVIQYVIRVP